MTDVQARFPGDEFHRQQMYDDQVAYHNTTFPTVPMDAQLQNHAFPQTLINYQPVIGSHLANIMGSDLPVSCIPVSDYVHAPDPSHGFLTMDHAHARRSDEGDSTCRPRLSAQQTATLEGWFKENPRPSTSEKRRYAQLLYLSTEKVNNWFQNRRAKSKQQSKSQKAYVFSVSEESGSNQPQYATPITEPKDCPSEEISPTLAAQQQQISTEHPFRLQEHSWHENSSQGSTYPAADLVHGSPLLNLENSIVSTCSEIDFGKNDSVTFRPSSMQEEWAHYHTAPSEMPLLPGELLLEQSTTHDPRNPMSQSCPGSYFMPQPIKQEVKTEDDGDTQLDSQPSPSSSATEQDASLDELSQHSTKSCEPATVQALGTSPANVYKSSLAARRRQHPAALTSMRTVSASKMTAASPCATESLCPQSVRRIRSTGNSLNISRGRIQKHATSSTQRSPLRTAFLESSALQYSISESHGTALESLGTAGSLHQEHCVEFSQFPCDAPGYENGYITSSPSDLTVPPLSASHTQLSFDESSFPISSPVTPLTQQLQSMVHLTDSSMPQSAPPHMTTFPGQSPPFDPHISPCAAGYGAPHPQLSISGYMDEVNRFHNPQTLPSAYPDHAPGILDLDRQPQVSRPSSSGDQIMFPASRYSEPSDGLHISFVDFPPAPVQIKPRGNQNFAFHNSSQKDMQETLKIQAK